MACNTCGCQITWCVDESTKDSYRWLHAPNGQPHDRQHVAPYSCVPKPLQTPGRLHLPSRPVYVCCTVSKSGPLHCNSPHRCKYGLAHLGSSPRRKRHVTRCCPTTTTPFVAYPADVSVTSYDVRSLAHIPVKATRINVSVFPHHTSSMMCYPCLGVLCSALVPFVCEHSKTIFCP
jgi:hypothetical protein